LKLDVLLTHAYNRISYNVLRSLAQKGLQVGIGSDMHSGMCQFSRLAALKFYHPPFYRYPEEFIRKIIEIVGSYLPTVYIPPDEDAFVVARYIDRFKHLPVIIPIASYEVIKLLNDKSRVTRLAQSLGIPTPNTIVPKDEAELSAFCRNNIEPTVLKLTESSGAHGVFYIYRNNIGEIFNYVFQRLKVPFNSIIAQEYVEGNGYGTSMLFNNGKLRAKFTHRRVMEKKSSGGPSSIRVSTENPLMEEYAEALLTRAGYHGVAMVEFKLNEKTGRIAFLEVNPRFWGSHGLAIQAGVDFPYLLYRIATAGDIDPVLSYRLGIKVKWVMGTITGAVDHLKWRRDFSIIKALLNNADAFDDLYLDDPAAFFGQIFSAAKKAYDMRDRATASLRSMT
jgi:predicted ATP-grasp superfamily ATP-dependent carboligase